MRFAAFSRVASSIAVLALALVAGCATSEPAPAPTTAAAWRFETVVYDVSPRVAERFHPPPEGGEASLAVLVDERDVRAQLEELSRTGLDVERSVRPVIVVADGERALVPPRGDTSSRAMGALASDWLQVHVGARGGHEWAACNFLFEVEWTAQSPQRIAGDTPQPLDHFISIVRSVRSSRAERDAVFVFVRAHPADVP